MTPGINRLNKILAKSSDSTAIEGLLKQRIDEIMSLRGSDMDLAATDGHAEHGLPGEEEYLRSGYYKIMLRRYLFASHFTRGKRVLDSCCGLGWGTYLIAASAKEVVAFDMDFSAVSFSRSQWQGENIDYICADALADCFKARSFDIVLCMETIEHFTREDGMIYLDVMGKTLKGNGILIGSSSFPDTRAEAESLCSRNPFHRHIYTDAEFKEFLGEVFSNVFILEKNIFVAY